MKNKVYLAVAAILGTPLLASAQFSQTRTLIGSFGGIIQMLTVIAASIALLVFIWGLVKYIAKAEDEGEKENGRRLMVNGAIALFVLFSIFGIIRWIGGEVGVGPGGPSIPPPVIGS